MILWLYIAYFFSHGNPTRAALDTKNSKFSRGSMPRTPLWKNAFGTHVSSHVSFNEGKIDVSGFVLAFSRDRHLSPFCFNLLSLICGKFPFSQLFHDLFQWFALCSPLPPLIPTHPHRFQLRSHLFPPISSYSHFVSACSFVSLQFRRFPLIPRVPSSIPCSRF